MKRTVFSLSILLLLTRLVSGTVLWAIPTTADPDSSVKNSSGPDLYKNLDLFTRVIKLIREDYVEEVSIKDLIYGAIRGMTMALDPHSVFMAPEAYKELKVDTEGRFGGVGLEVTLRNNLITVVTPIEDSPAAKAGIKEGDLILKIEGSPTKELGLDESVRLMRGSRGTRVRLIVFREGWKEPQEMTLRRDIIRIKSVRAEMPEDGLGYIRIASFQENTSGELRRAEESLAKKSKGGLKGLILDLRNNPGGLLDEAVRVSDMFIDSGLIVTTIGRSEEELDKREATKNGEPSYPLIVLINGGSASAAEIVAGALQDHKRAVVLGTTSFGKGTVQSVFDLGDGAALKLTIAKYYTPKGRSIQAEGIKPDIVVEARRPANFTKDRALHEKDLKGHLPSHSEKKPETLPAVADEDYQKKVALDYLRSWEVFGK